MRRSYYILILFLILILGSFYIFNFEIMKKDFYSVDSEIKEFTIEPKDIIYSINSYYSIDDEELSEVNELTKEVDLIFNSTLAKYGDEYKVFITYEWLKNVKISSYAIAMCFSDDEPDSMETSFLRQRLERKTLNSKWNLKNVSKNSCYTMDTNRGYIWTNMVGDRTLYNKKDIFQIVLPQEMIDKFYLQFAYSKYGYINPSFNLNSYGVEFEGNRNINKIKIDNFNFIDEQF